MRRMIRERDYQKAYQLAAGHGLLSGEAFRDAEWMAGWLALEKLGDAAKAEAHFRVFGAGVASAQQHAFSDLLQYGHGDLLVAAV